MPDLITVTYEIADGYAGGHRPIRFQIDPSDYEGMTRDEAEEELHQCALAHMTENHGPEIEDVAGILDQLKLSED